MSSPFASRLDTNYCPTDQEDLEIRSLLVEPTLRLKKLDDEIADLQKSMDKLVEERNGLQSYVQAHSALISPVRRLPRDIIQEIFLACMPTHRNCVMSATEAPILLGRICSAWRAISLNTPRLWASVHVVEPDWPGGERWTGVHAHGDDCIPFIGALIPFLPRWQHVHLTIPGALLFDTMGNFDVAMPWLESITFHCPTFPDGQPARPWNILRGPRLSRLSIPNGLFVLETLPVLWNQLTTLTIGGPDLPGATTTSVLFVISRCYQLRSCTLLLLDRPDDLSGHPVVELPFLHTLAIRCFSANLLTRLSLPELRNFVLLGRFVETDCPTLTDFLARSNRLESFDINENAFLAPSLHDSLRSLRPTVERLRIRRTLICEWFQAVDDATLGVLASSGLLPALRHLIIDDGTHLSDPAVLQFITTRMLGSNPPTLWRVEIQFDRDATDDIMPALQPFLDTGLAVSLNYTSIMSLSLSPWEGLDEDVYKNVLSRDINPRPMNYW
ncbi:hypothetical protein MSAN_00583700 [Mycena sanguinolenta]|uniref:F-box domain-containing protein n=1 Tax=Mycena sanguinolenta TaxID=230812 RepID=A0A8H6ZA18_9AGAR|nr:hypothetical protein MSAN_00583700 [Mycena sanguinolenta]